MLTPSRISACLTTTLQTLPAPKSGNPLLVVARRRSHPLDLHAPRVALQFPPRRSWSNNDPPPQIHQWASPTHNRTCSSTVLSHPPLPFLSLVDSFSQILISLVLMAGETTAIRPQLINCLVSALVLAPVWLHHSWASHRWPEASHPPPAKGVDGTQGQSGQLSRCYWWCATLLPWCFRKWNTGAWYCSSTSFGYYFRSLPACWLPTGATGSWENWQPEQGLPHPEPLLSPVSVHWWYPPSWHHCQWGIHDTEERNLATTITSWPSSGRVQWISWCHDRQHRGTCFKLSLEICSQ